VFRVLYVEDHPAQRDIMAQMLELSGYQVAVANDGVDGVAQAQSWKPDLVLMDLRMPRMDGFEAIRALRSDPATADIPIIAISAWASAKHKERAIEAGANEHFTKPVDLTRLLETINRYLTQKESSQSPRR
jgi:two-component system cell cycle response regulator DivK